MVGPYPNGVGVGDQGLGMSIGPLSGVPFGEWSVVYGDGGSEKKVHRGSGVGNRGDSGVNGAQKCILAHISFFNILPVIVQPS